MYAFFIIFFFFFQAEDGIRDFHVTGVQTCALPIWGFTMARLLSRNCSFAEAWTPVESGRSRNWNNNSLLDSDEKGCPRSVACRSEERRVGKECRSRWSQDH